MADQHLRCPNCTSGVVLKEDGTAVCSNCGGSFTWKAGEAKLAQVGEFDALKADVHELQQRLPASTPGQPPEDPSRKPDPPFDDEEEGEDDDEEDL